MAAQCNPQDFAVDALEANEDLFTTDLLEVFIPKVMDIAQLMFERVVSDMKGEITKTKPATGDVQANRMLDEYG